MSFDSTLDSSASPHKDVPQQGADLFFQAAIQYGYRYVLGNPGTTEAPFMDALTRYPELQFMLFLQENSATGAADGIARMTGQPALVNLHLGPGLSNGLSNMHNARRAQVPMVVTVGDHDMRHLLEDSPLASDIESIARAECKWVWTVKDASELAATLYRATSIALTPPQGPVCLILPTNVLTDSPRTANGNIPHIPELHVPTLGQAPTHDIERAATLLLAAQNPIIFVADIEQAAHEHIGRLAAQTNARIVYEPFPRRFDGPVYPKSTWLPYFSEERRALLAQADLLFLVGASGFTTLFFYANDPAPVVAPGTQVLHLTSDLGALGKNERGSFPLYGDVTTTLAHFITVIEQKQGTMKPKEERRQANMAASPQPAQQNTATTDGLIHPVEFMQALRQILPADTILVDEAITARQPMVEYVLGAETPVTSYLAVRGASIGGGLPLAVGAKIGAPHRPVVVVSGDGSAMYTIQSLWTAAHYHLPVLFIICNNASYDIIKLEMLRLGGTLAASDATILDAIAGLGGPQLDFVQLAQGMGVRGWTIQRRADLMPNLKAALALTERGEPALVDVHLSALPISALQKRYSASRI
ncbi:MAG: acetolactate synthase large subunit [Ktedonobacteraceae bacterium]